MAHPGPNNKIVERERQQGPYVLPLLGSRMCPWVPWVHSLLVKLKYDWESKCGKGKVATLKMKGT